MYILRQLAESLVEGEVLDLSGAGEASWQSADVLPRMILKIDEGLYAHDTISVASFGGTATVQLPNEYVNTQRLFVLLRTSQTIKVATASPDHATSSVLVRAGDTSPQNGVLSFVDRVTSITLTNQEGVAATVETFLFQYPDLDSPESWRDGAFAIGVQ